MLEFKYGDKGFDPIFRARVENFLRPSHSRQSQNTLEVSAKIIVKL